MSTKSQVSRFVAEMVRRVPAAARRLHEDEDGAPEASTIIMIAFVAIPLIIGLTVFGQKILDTLAEWYKQITGPTSPTF